MTFLDSRVSLYLSNGHSVEGGKWGMKHGWWEDGGLGQYSGTSLIQISLTQNLINPNTFGGALFNDTHGYFAVH